MTKIHLKVLVTSLNFTPTNLLSHLQIWSKMLKIFWPLERIHARWRFENISREIPPARMASFKSSLLFSSIGYVTNCFRYCFRMWIFIIFERRSSWYSRKKLLGFQVLVLSNKIIFTIFWKINPIIVIRLLIFIE